MVQIAVSEAKSKIPELLDRVENGESFTITRDGVPVARLVPAAVGRRSSPAEIVEGFRRFRDAHPLNGLSIRELIEEGRRF